MKNFFKFIPLCLLLFLFAQNNASASSLSLNIDANKVKTGEVFTATLYLNTEGQSINTIGGNLSFDTTFLKIEKVNIGRSFVSFWLEKPDTQIPGNVHFSGIVPGGVNVNHDEVFSVVFRAEKEGSVDLVLKDISLLINDGKGTSIPVKVSNANVKIIKNINNTLLPVVSQDTVLPEKFTIIRTRDQSIYDNKWFLVFSTLDKDSGVDHYQVCEFWRCVNAESPYLLKYQTPFYHIVVRAYDENGNVRVSTLNFPSPRMLLVFLFFIVIIYLCFYLRKNLERK